MRLVKESGSGTRPCSSFSGCRLRHRAGRGRRCGMSFLIYEDTFKRKTRAAKAALVDNASFSQIIQYSPDSGNEKGRKGTLLALDGLFHPLNHIVGKTDGFVGSGWRTGNFKFAHKCLLAILLRSLFCFANYKLLISSWSTTLMPFLPRAEAAATGSVTRKIM